MRLKEAMPLVYFLPVVQSPSLRELTALQENPVGTAVMG
jgi:hypothetical protein